MERDVEAGDGGSLGAPACATARFGTVRLLRCPVDAPDPFSPRLDLQFGVPTKPIGLVIVALAPGWSKAGACLEALAEALDVAQRDGATATVALIGAAPAPDADSAPPLFRRLARCPTVRLPDPASEAALAQAVSAWATLAAAADEDAAIDAYLRDAEPEPDAAAPADPAAVMRRAEAMAAWRDLARSEDRRALRDHIARFPGEPSWAAARERLAALEWARLGTGAQADAVAYQAFLSEFWDSPFAPAALARRDAALRRDAARRGAEAAAGPLRLAQLPRSTHLDPPSADGRKSTKQLAKPFGPTVAVPRSIGIAGVTIVSLAAVMTIMAIVPLAGVILFTAVRGVVDWAGPLVRVLLGV